MDKDRFFFRKRNQIISKLKDLPYSAILLLSIAVSLGLVMMYSAAQGSFKPWAYKQLFRFIVLFPVMIIIALIDIRKIFRISYIAYFTVLFMLFIVEIYGSTAMGATRWIDLGIIKLQPSELMKISLVLALAKYFHNITQQDAWRTWSLIPPLVISIVPFLLIVKQPDLGTGLILIFVAGTIFFLAGVRLWKFAAIILSSIAIMPFVWKLLHEYQKKRIITFLNPENDPLGAGYNIIQSKIAIGSGGLIGKGLLNGSQTQLNFLPEHQTDFVFTMLAEELGFVTCIALLIVYFILIYMGILIAVNSRSHYGRLLASGAVSIFFIHTFINIAMVTGMLPVVGAPLPLISYGGTIMTTILVGFGLIFNVHIHRNVAIGQNSKDIF